MSGLELEGDIRKYVKTSPNGYAHCVTVKHMNTLTILKPHIIRILEICILH